ncbi:hypothetical protein E2C01_091841 [Portunus trituberculatus]|uniref:Uncharacterized protein n=1 Tax=Portunus trituberculatus TaxID=210409 RepID=A0A5B7JPR8_PORTR|nr:hypothetical protein [Portunus trituberculatus]
MFAIWWGARLLFGGDSKPADYSGTGCSGIRFDSWLGVFVAIPPASFSSCKYLDVDSVVG